MTRGWFNIVSTTLLLSLHAGKHTKHHGKSSSLSSVNQRVKGIIFNGHLKIFFFVLIMNDSELFGSKVEDELMT